jgi:hypothetical protein
MIAFFERLTVVVEKCNTELKFYKFEKERKGQFLSNKN